MTTNSQVFGRLSLRVSRGALRVARVTHRPPRLFKLAFSHWGGRLF